MKIRGNTIGIPNPQPNWDQTDSTQADYIRNKPTEYVIVGQSKYAEIWAKENWTWEFDFEDNDPNNLLSSIAKYKNPPLANS